MARTARAETREASGRKRRALLGGAELKLDVRGKDSGYTYRWFNDTKNRIARAKDADWEPVESEGISVGAEGQRNSDLGSGVSQIVGTDDRGQPIRAILMRKRKDWHEEDQREKQRPIDETEAAMKRGAIAPSNHLGQDETYIPREGITFREDK